MKKIFTTLSIVLVFLFNNTQAQDGAYLMTDATKTITSCRATLDMDLGCTRTGVAVYCANLDRAYTFVSDAGTLINANLTFHVLDDDFIYVYDGPSTASPLIASWTGGTTLDLFTGLNATATGSVLTIRFVSNGSKGQYFTDGFDDYTGWSILIGCQPNSVNGNPPAGDNCAAAPQICNLNGYTGNTSGWYNEDNGLLEGALAPGFTGSIENNSWINFVAGASTATLVVKSANCLFTGSGIQGVVYASTNCSTFTPVSGGNFSQSTSSGTQTLSLIGLTAGQDYYLMLDGFGGNVCDYTVTAAGNVQTLNTNSSATSNTICPNQTFTVTATAGATSYNWNPMPASTSSNTAVYNNISSTSVITTTAVGYCGASATVALTMSVVSTAVSITSGTICSGTSTVLSASGATTYSWSPNIGLSSTTGATVTVNPTTSIVYTVTGSSGGSCLNTNTTAVTVNLTPTTTASTSGTLTCLNTSVDLNSTLAGASYTWSAPSGGSVSSANTQSTTASLAAGTYTLKVKSAAGCTYSTTTTVTQNTTTPTSVASNSGTLTCTTTSVNLNSTLAGMNYTWTSPAGGSLTNANSQNATASLAGGTYSLAVVNPTNGCTYNTTTSVSQNTAVPTTIASNSGSITCTTPTINLNSTLAGMSYTWTAPIGGSITNVNTQNTSAFGAAGIYSLTVKNTNGCVYSTTTSVGQNTVAPTGVDAGATQSLTCGSSFVTISGSVASPTNATVLWTGAGFSSSQTTFTTNVNGAGVYTLTATNPLNGCTASSTVQVSPSAGAPTVTSTATSGTITCTNTLVNVSIETSISPVSYQWTGPGIVGTNTLSSISVNKGGTYSYTLTNTTNSCTTVNNVIVTSNTIIPSINASVNGVLTCSTNSVTLSSTSSGVDFTWLAPSNGTLSASSASVTSASGSIGNYSLMITDPSNGCSTSTVVAVTQNTVAPAINASVNGVLTCSTNSVTLSSTSSGVDFTWLAPSNGTLSASSASTTSASGSIGNYSLTITDQVNGCSSSTVVAVTQNTVAPTINASVNGVLTCSTNSVTLSSTSSGVDFTWLAPSNGTLSASSASVTSASGSIGNYSLTITDPSNGCSSSTVVVVTQNTVAPTINASVNGVLTCSTNSVTLSSTSIGVDFTWLAPSNGTLSASSASITSASGVAGNYSLAVRDQLNGCSSSTIIVVSQNTVSPLIDASVTGTLTCVTNSVILSTTVASMNYTWTAPLNGLITSVNSQTTLASGANGNYSLTIVDPSNGCLSSTVIAVKQNTTTPSSLADATGTITCLTNTVTLDASASGMNYNWTAAIGSSVSTPTDQTTIATGSGPYTLTIVNPVNGCTYSISTTPIEDKVAPNAHALSTGTITCNNLTATVSSSVTGMNYAWSGSVSGSVVAPTASLTNVTSAGDYTVIITNPVNSCTNSAVTTVTQNIVPPTVVVTNTTISCTNTFVIGAFSPNATYSWLAQSGSILSGSATAIPTVVGDAAGQYVVTVTDNSNGCTNTGTVIVAITPVNAAFTANPMSGTAPLAVDFTNQSTGATNYSWTFADGNSSVAVNPSNTFSTTGSYVVNLVATGNSALCISTASLTIEVYENTTIVIPNVFTPNGDGKNDAFKITTTGLKDLNCTIFNRWGTKLYTIETVTGSWDGSGSSDGTYFYILIANGMDGKEYKQQGSLNLFR